MEVDIQASCWYHLGGSFGIPWQFKWKGVGPPVECFQGEQEGQTHNCYGKDKGNFNYEIND